MSCYVMSGAILCRVSKSFLRFAQLELFAIREVRYVTLTLCLVLSCLVLSCLVLSCLVLSCLVLSCLVLSCLVLSCLVLSCLVLSCLVLPCLVLPCLVLPCLVLPCLVLFRFISPYFTLSNLASHSFTFSYLALSCLIPYYTFAMFLFLGV
jgi:hypothetical protein